MAKIYILNASNLKMNSLHLQLATIKTIIYIPEQRKFCYQNTAYVVKKLKHALPQHLTKHTAEI